jgi:hypothetical protein
MGGECSMHRRDEKCLQNFGQETWWEEMTQKT